MATFCGLTARRLGSHVSKCPRLTNLAKPRLMPGKTQVRYHWSDRLPMIIRPSFWSSLYPGIAKRIREGKPSKTPAQIARSKQWNPATYYIWMFMLIGSQSINLIVLKNEWTVFSRMADTKIAALKEVIERLQRGEDVDVERILGTGDERQEQEWKDVLQEIEEEDRLWQNKARKKARRAARKAEREAAAAANEGRSMSEQPQQPEQRDSDTGNNDRSSSPTLQAIWSRLGFS